MANDFQDIWEMQESIIYAICRYFKIKFKAFLQPQIFFKREYGENDLETLAMLRTFRNSCDEKIYSYKKMKDAEINIDFYEKVKKIINTDDFIVDVTDLFDNMDGVYMDNCHVYEEYNKVIAEKIYCEIKDML